ncbi:extracellular solute-binding protein [Streptomyces litchfieldiae]|uniref:Extracellular solute-binding protein n=1 Tax=Streptomyces litchfieldiae TaxID=3075543 RepID=A0ABU2MZ81_9ACTN|nr:extracellular solute-binding protein [Streptomyces sp. DSM 44938]MDT0346816.1 extracellular solute-binding protein [Streptomyces sp. DSM 44938]
MHARSLAPMDRRRFLGLSAGALGAAAVSGCALSVANGAGRDPVTVMASDGDFPPEMVQQAAEELDIRIDLVKYDPTRLTAMLASGQPPDLVRGLGALDTPYLVARDVAEDLDPYFAGSSILKADDLDPVNDLWRFDGQRQGAGPRYGMAKDFSQDSMFWYNRALFEQAGVDDYPPDDEPLTYEEWLDLGKRVVQQDGGRTTVYGMSCNGLSPVGNLMAITAAAGGSLFSEDLGRVDFSTPEARQALSWYLEYVQARVGPSLIDPDPNVWDGPTYQANRMAMSGNGYWFGGMVGGSSPEIATASRLAPAPVFAGKPRVSTCQAGTGFWMPRKAPHKDTAWRLFEWYMGEGPAQGRASGGWGIPTLKSLRSLMPGEQPFQEQSLRVQNAELEYFSVLSFTPYVRSTALDAVFNQVMPAAMRGDMSLDAAIGRLNDDMNHQMDLGKELVP